MTDAELIALAALVNADVAWFQGHVAYATASGQPPMCEFQSEARGKLQDEMKRREVKP